MPGSRPTTLVCPVCGQAASGECPPLCSSDGELRRLHGGGLLATVAHELRGPLAAVLYALQARVKCDDGDPAARRTWEIVERQARRAARIIDDLNDACAGSWYKLSLCTELADVAE